MGFKTDFLSDWQCFIAQTVIYTFLQQSLRIFTKNYFAAVLESG